MLEKKISALLLNTLFMQKTTNKQKSYYYVVQIFCKLHQVILFQSICFAEH